ncbi:hypothetical protein SF12_15445 [Streptomyces sp. MBRL 601]|nr:hypothetical protein SF12_15445 [Streptomyces sp. MBRL 601]
MLKRRPGWFLPGEFSWCWLSRPVLAERPGRASRKRPGTSPPTGRCSGRFPVSRADSPHGIRPGVCAVCQDTYVREGRSKLPGARAPAYTVEGRPPRRPPDSGNVPQDISGIAFLDSRAPHLVTLRGV